MSTAINKMVVAERTRHRAAIEERDALIRELWDQLSPCARGLWEESADDEEPDAALLRLIVTADEPDLSDIREEGS